MNPVMKFISSILHSALGTRHSLLHLRLITLIGVIVPQRLRSSWKQEWEAELRYRELLLAEWESLNWRNKLELFWHSLGAFWDALWLQTYRWEDEMIQDLRYGVRMLAKNPGFTFVAVLCLALGIGANTAIFSVLNAALWRPLPATTDPSRLVSVQRSDESGTPLSYPYFAALRERHDVFSGFAATVDTALSFGNGVRSEVVLGALASGNYFDVLGVRPALGHGFLAEEDRTPGANPVVVLSHNFWRSHFDGDPQVIGRAIVLNGHRFTVIGVTPANFDGTSAPVKISLWMPMMMYKEAMPDAAPDFLSDWQMLRFNAIGRLQDGISIERAQAALDVVGGQIRQANPLPPDQRGDPNRDNSLKLVRPQGIFGPLRSMAATPSIILAAVVMIVLLISCANVANLLLARAAVRRKEIAVRLALGASRLRLLRQLLTESLLLSLLGAGAGLVLAYWLMQLLPTFSPPFPPPFTLSIEILMDGRALGFTLLLSLVTGVIFGLAPALRASRPDVVPALKDENGSEAGRGRTFNLRNALVVTQVALSLVLLLGAGLFIRSMQRAQAFDLGFKPENVLALSFNLQLQGYDQVRGKEFYPQLMERLERLPGVQSVSIANLLPLGFMGRAMNLTPVDREVPPNEWPSAGYFAVGVRYFETIGMTLLGGRDFTPQDTATAPRVAIVSAGLARRLWPGLKELREAIGKQVRLSGPDNSLCEIIGIVGDAKNSQFMPLESQEFPTLYRPYTQDYSARASLVLRTNGAPEDLIPAVRREVAALDENLPAQEIQPLSENVALALWSVRAGAGMLGIFGALGLLVAAVGIYGVMSFAVAHRTREIGVRMALGAQQRDVLKLIVGQGIVLAVIGIVVGLALALAVTRLLANQLYGLSATDPVTFVGVSIFLLGVAVVACYLPARRATRVDPLAALRHE